MAHPPRTIEEHERSILAFQRTRNHTTKDQTTTYTMRNPRVFSFSSKRGQMNTFIDDVGNRKKDIFLLFLDTELLFPFPSSYEQFESWSP